MDNAVAVMEFAEQEGDDVVFKQEDGFTLVTVENTTVSSLLEAMISHTDDALVSPAQSSSTSQPDSDGLIAYDGDMFEFDEEEGETNTPVDESTAALVAQEVAQTDPAIPVSDEQRSATSAEDAVEPDDTENNEALHEAINEYAA